METDKIQIFLLHFAGGSNYSFDFLKKHLKMGDVRLFPLELPGRGKRFGEKLLRDKKDAIEDYSQQIKKLRNNRPYLIYGHSMGATLGLSVAKSMEDSGDKPYQLIVSGNAGPGAKKSEERKAKGDRYLMNDEDFKTELKELGGFADEVMENEELFDLFSKILRADFELLEKADGVEKDMKIGLPLYALMGSEENSVGEIENWRNFTTKQFQYKILEGGHFFIHKHPEAIANVIKNFLNKIRLFPAS